MRAIIKATPNGIRGLDNALRFNQDFGRFCYSDKSLEEVEKEEYKSGLVEGMFIEKGHNSPLEQFTINFVLEDISKALAITLNNQKFGSTCEKSARYTFIPEDLSEKQRDSYMKWYEWFQGAIKKHYPQDKFSGLYQEGSGKKTPIQKLSQENARYMASSFIPMRMGHKMDLAHLNKIVYGFKKFAQENSDSDDFFKRRLSQEMQEFTELPEIQEFSYKGRGFPQKAGIGLNLFGEENEFVFGKDVYSYNDYSSFASFAQRQRHRTINHHIIEGYELRAPFGFFIPPLVKKYSAEKEWLNDLNEIAEEDIPQAQLIYFGFSGNTKELPMMASERICNNTQLETNMGIKKFLGEYSKKNPDIEDLVLPDCQKYGCSKGGCVLGPKEYNTRLI